MKTLLLSLSFILSIAIIFISCSEEAVTPTGGSTEVVDTGTFIYPFNVGDT